ncbi:MAG: hypothetical protein KatS3mg050_0707 [Litorilinea sp.]|nr:MAG: hypothetical protein KatS3mg050_0707 [Litorilinea sp.]
MVAVIAISSWHIGNYMSTFDGWVMAAIMGATLGFCNFLCAHNIFKAGSTSRFPSFVGLIFFAITSTWMQYTYFRENPEIGVTLLYNVNLDALALGIWAPAAEILLGWMYAANTRTQRVSHHLSSSPSPLGSLAKALTRRIEQDMAKHPYPQDLRSPEPDMNPSVVHTHLTPFKLDTNANGGSVQMNDHKAAYDHEPYRETEELTKSEAMERLLNLFADNPHATYEQVASAIGRSKATVANYMRELKEEGRVQVSDEEGVQVTES